MEAVKLIGTAVAMLIGLILTPVVASATETATSETSVTNISGLTEIIELIPYIYVFVIIGAGLLTMYHFYKD